MNIGLGLDLGRAAIRSGASEPFTPNDLPESYRTNGGFWLAENQTTSGGKVTTWTDEWGVRNLSQATASARPTDGTVNGYPAAVWPDTANDVLLRAGAAFTPKFWLLVMQHKAGTEATWGTDYPALIGNGATGAQVYRVMGSTSDTDALYSGTAWADESRINGGALTSTMLPLPLSVVVLESTVDTPATWGVGAGTGASGRGWHGPIAAAIALGVAPTTTERQKLEGWAAHKWGITLVDGHPYKDTAP